mgnify:CR=1 FL=1
MSITKRLGNWEPSPQRWDCAPRSECKEKGHSQTASQEALMQIDKEEANILVVDDDKQLADILTEYLNTLGYQAVAAYGGSEGLTRFRQ